MITPGYCREMARYNAWQNRQLSGLLQGMEAGELTRDRGAFFGSILGTLNHLVWGDLIWMARFDGSDRPVGGIGDGTARHDGYEGWAGERAALDARIETWAAGVGEAALRGDLRWVSGATGQEATRPLATCVVHMFNHQTHHRGQVHAMLTAAGSAAPVSDLVFMPGAE
ncbi:DinB family protein [Pukyongiella litopenaei]|uniref:Damage-inducible protein DinB n=1 Tax=Pukyongiella litopenaei TaxID=2605946 RepID=A0A2S0MQS3_9RHOB|nr:DinB family protein [Pukyongiella litopenaei]AVO38187.1 damage-inducible protein DinB [Pukyongiella litopenaei]